MVDFINHFYLVVSDIPNPWRNHKYIFFSFFFKEGTSMKPISFGPPVLFFQRKSHLDPETGNSLENLLHTGSYVLGPEAAFGINI